MAPSCAHPSSCLEEVNPSFFPCSLSFTIVLVFSIVFVACGAEVLRADQSVPSGATLLTLQASFGSRLGSWFEPFYLAGAFLAMFGTLYGLSVFYC